MYSKFCLLIPTLMATTILSPSPTIAAEAGNADADSTIIVNGVKVDEGQNRATASGALGVKSLLDTPFSVTVVDKEELARRQVTTIGQIFINDPSVSSFATAGTTNWWGTQIRGLGVRNYYIDDVPLLLYWGGDFPLESVESVEALKGLSGFMYGFGAPGGAIAYRTKRPAAKPMLTTEMGYRTNSVFYGRIDASGPLTSDGKLAYRLNLAGEKGTAYNEAGVNRWLGALALDYNFSSDLKWYATATYEDSKLKHEPFQIYWSDYQDTVLPRATYAYENLNIANSYYRTKTLAVATGLDWSFAKDWSVRLTYGYTRKLHNSNKIFVDMLNQAGDYQGHQYNFAELDQNHFMQGMVRGSFATGPVRHDIVAGLSYIASPSQFGLDDYYWGDDFTGNINRAQPFRVTRDVRFGLEGSPSEEQQRAVFISDTLHLGDHVQAIAGARYTRYKLLDLDNDPTVDSGYCANALTPTFALIYKPFPYVSLYGSYVESMEGGSRVGVQYANFGEVLKATVSRQYEVGAKYEQGGLSLTTAGFRVERAAQIEEDRGGAQLYLTQDGLTVYKGVEAIGSYRVNAAFKFGLGAVYLDPSIRNVSAGNEALLGNLPAEAARWQLTGNAEYAIPAIRGLSVHGNVRYFGKAPTSDANTLFIPSRTLTNIGFQYQASIGGQRVDFTGNVNNLFNVEYWGQSNIGEGINGALSGKIYW